MKNSLRYLKLWQKKRNEMPVDADLKGDWGQMQSLLDKALPVANPPAGANPSPASGFNLMHLLLTGLAAAAITCAIWYAVKTKTPAHNDTSNNIVHVDSTNKAMAVDSGNAYLAAPTVEHPDSLTANTKTLPPPAPATDKGTVPAPVSRTDSKDTLTEDKKASLAGENIAAGSRPVIAPATNANNGVGLRPGSNKNNGLSPSGVTDKRAVVAGSGHGLAPVGNHTGSSTPADSARRGYKTAAGAIISSRGKLMAINSNIAANKKPSSRSITRRSGPHPNSRANSNGTGSHAIVNNGKGPATGNSFLHDDSRRDAGFLKARPSNPAFNLGTGNSATLASLGLSRKTIQPLQPNPAPGNKKDTKAKAKDAKPSTPSKLGGGLLIGFNSAGSFTPKAQNANFYGSLPADPYLGLFATYNVSDKWAVGMQLRVLNPQKISGSYNHENGSKVDSNQIIKITDSRKAYTVDVPLHLIYKANDQLSFKAGPVFSIPVKQLKGSATLQPANIKTDSNYYAHTIAQLDSTKYQPKFNYGISLGVSYQVNRFIFGVDYLKNLGGYQVNSPFGNYKSHNGTLQITIGFKLKK